MLAGLAAHAQGRLAVDVCSVYGVGLPASAAVPSGGMPALAQDADPDDEPRKHGADQDGPCALVALAAGGVADAPRASIAAARVAGRGAAVVPSAAVPDACAEWIAQRKQGPPVRA